MRSKSIFVLLIVLIVSGVSQAAFIFDSTSSWTGTSMGAFGGDALIGQTFGAEIGNTRLDYFSFYVADDVNPDFMIFNFHVMEWSIPQLKPVGPVIYSSGLISSTNNHGIGGWEKITFEINGLELESAGSKAYIAIVSVPSGVNGTCWLGYVGDVYSGEFTYASGGINDALTTNWTTDYPGHNGDMAFEIGFNVPEPATLSLLVTCGLTFVQKRRKL